MRDDLAQRALAYHAEPKPGKLKVVSSKPTSTQEDLTLTYTPGVAEPVRAIADDPSNAYRYTIKGNLVAVMTNGTAVLGLGNVGPLASKPVMEGKAVLFQHFADIDVFDIEVDAEDTQAFIKTAVAIAPTFGGINLEDIKAPECFVIEQALKEQLNIPVFHDDQHGTAIVVAAGLLNALELQGKNLKHVKIVCVGAGAAGIASANLLLKLGALLENMTLVDSRGVVHDEREDLNRYKQAFARKTNARTLKDVMSGADVFIGVARPNLLTADMLTSMAEKPIVFALSNPTPEIMPELAHLVRDDVILATGRSDYPNQINNAVCFPYIFRGALDVRAHCINEAMHLAAVHALCDLAKQDVPDNILQLYSGDLSFGPHYIIPTPLDPRLRDCIAGAVAKAAVESGVSQL